MSTPVHMSSDLDVRVVEELLRTLTKGQRALQMYLPNNPVYQRAMEALVEAFTPVWNVTGRLVLEIHEQHIEWEGVAVYQQSGGGSEGLAWQLYTDGLRRLTLLPGVEAEEIIRLLHVVNRARLLPVDAADDLLTLLWEQEFVLITYAFVEVIGEGTEFIQESEAHEAAAEPGEARREIDDARGAPNNSGLVDLTDFDATPYFLDEAETRLIRSELDDEYRRDYRTFAIDALMDILETQREPAVRHEAVALLEDVLPAQLAAGGFRAVARILRELRVIAARAPGLDQELHTSVLSFEERLSQPEILEQLFRALEDAIGRPDNEDVSEVMRELKPSALPTILSHLGRTLNPDVRRALEPSLEGLARAAPNALSAVLENGPPEALDPAIALAARLGITGLVPQIIGHYKSGGVALRLTAITALAGFGTPTAIATVEEALGDPDRTVRQAALALLQQRGGSGGMVRRLEGLLFAETDGGWDRLERRALFEAYGALAGDAALPRIRELLEPRGFFRRRAHPDVRACALFGLGKVRSLDARMLVDTYTTDREPVVRSAANSVLRDWMP